MSSIFYVGEFDFNRKVAAAVRIMNNCKAIQAYGNLNIKIVGYSDIPTMQQDGLPILNVPRGENMLQKLFYYLFRSFFIIRLVNKNGTKNSIIIYYGESTRILLPIYIYCQLKRIKLLVDVVEWYDYASLPYGKYGPLALDVHICLTRLIPRCDGVIAISSYLTHYFKNRGLKTITVPIIVDTFKDENEPAYNLGFEPNYLNLIYAGFPGQKDFVLNVVNAVEKLSSEGLRVKFHLLGPTQTQLEALSIKSYSDAIVCYGKVPQERVPSYLKQADFSVLLRPDKRYAHAGFPTKFVESLNAGLPVIANYTSDLALYLKDGYNGFVVENCSTDALVEKISYIISLDKSVFAELKVRAKQTAIENFDYRLYSKPLSEFLSNIQNNQQSKIHIETV
jgi:glycosyltransferase involved in cell wall biosynthesis